MGTRIFIQHWNSFIFALRISALKATQTQNTTCISLDSIIFKPHPFPVPVSVFFLQGDVSRGAVSVSTERGGGSAPLRQCNISLPDGSCCSVPLRAGVSIRDLLLGLCEKLCINLAAIDLFLVGGEKVQHKWMWDCSEYLHFRLYKSSTTITLNQIKQTKLSLAWLLPKKKQKGNSS